MARTGLDITVDKRRCVALARRLATIEPRAAHFLPRPARLEAEAHVVDFYLAWVGICQQTRTLDGMVGGVRHRGSDYLAHRLCAVLDEDPERFSAGRLARVTPGELRAWLSDDGDPAHSTVDRVEERVRLLKDMGRRLAEGYGGQASNIIAASKGKLGGPRGLLARLARFEAYRDPVRKKSFLLIHFLRGLGVFEPPDPERLDLPVDYHILRVFLRAGAVRVGGPRAAELLAGGAMGAEEDVALRVAAVRAGRAMARIVPLARLDLLLWMLGRNCCFYEHEPVCRTGPCTLGERCSFLASTDLHCGQRCPLDGVCAGSLDAAYAAIREPSFDTDLY